jgi:murein DD-endopeptidase MepM/ murein hydrolase activator NlpD
MAQQRISFSIATHPPVHPPVASPADSTLKASAKVQGEASERTPHKPPKSRLSKAKRRKPVPHERPAAATALLQTRPTPPLLPSARRRFLPRWNRSTGQVAGLAAAAVAIILGAAWLQVAYAPSGEAVAGSTVVRLPRIQPTAGQPKATPAQRRALSERLADVEHATYRRRYSRTIRIGRGDRLLQLLILEGVPRREAFNAIQVLAKVFELRKLRTGQRVELVYGIIDNQPQRFAGLRFELGNGARAISAMRQGKGPFTATDVKKRLRPELVRGTGRIETSLYVAGLKAGVPPAVMIQLIQIYSFDVDFQREIRKGDTFRVLFRNYYDDEGKLVRQGDIIYAALTLRGDALQLYRFAPRSGRIDYFNPQGHSVRKALMRTPINGARLTSGFGRRRHPILRYTKVHTGSDFAAPRGTPFYAAGDGTIVKLGPAGGYGNYIRIRHNADYETAYAHMQRFATGLGVGSRVRQGQIIGYVGTSGLSSGPHLHYEVHYKGRPVNPLGLRLATGQKLAGLDLREFMVRRTLINNMYLSRAKDVRLASAPRRQLDQPAN